MASALAAGLLLRAAFVHCRPEVTGDTLIYGDIAQNLLQHHVYGVTSNGIRPTYIRLPGYPLLLAACFALFGVGKYYAVLWVNVAMDLMTCALVGKLAERLCGRKAGLAALWLAALCPFTANYCAAALTETPSLFCVALAFLALERVSAAEKDQSRGRARLGWAAVVGAALLWAVLLRPEQGLLSAAVVPAMVWIGWRGAGRAAAWRRAVVPAGVACAVVLVPLLAWGVRNARVMGRFEPLAPKSATDPGEAVPHGFDHWFRTWGVEFASTFNVYWNYDGAQIAMADVPPRAMDNAEQRAQTEEALGAYDKVGLARPEFDAAFEQIAEERDRLHPARSYVLLPLAREADMWLRPRTELTDMPLEWWRWREHPAESAMACGYAALNAALLALAGWGMWRSRRRWGAMEWGMVGFVVIRCALLLTLDNSEPRYTLECFPVLLVFAGMAVGRVAGLGSQISARPNSGV